MDPATGKGFDRGNTFVSGWDTILDISGFRTVVTVKNGSWYDTDTGVVPDVYLSDPELFYNRARLTELINALN